MESNEAQKAPTAESLPTRTRAKRRKKAAGPKRKPGKPPFAPTDGQRDMVRLAVAAGIKQDDISTAIGITKPTLEKHFRRELDGGNTSVIVQAMGKLVQIATGKDPTADSKTVLSACTFILERRGKGSFDPPTMRQELTGKDGGPVLTATADLTKLTDEELEARIAELGGRARTTAA